jgi:hypothetical protein
MNVFITSMLNLLQGGNNVQVPFLAIYDPAYFLQKPLFYHCYMTASLV